jgi:hypothetical protein
MYKADFRLSRLALIVGLATLVMLTRVASSFAQITEFTDRSFWEDEIAVALPDYTYHNEDFESDPGGNTAILTPYTTAGGLEFKGVEYDLGFQIIPGDSPTTLDNGTQRLHFRDFEFGGSFPTVYGGGLEVILPSPSVLAIGFDFGTRDGEYGTVWSVEVGETTVFLESSVPSFVGFVGDSTPISSFVLRGDGATQGGLTIDNVTFYVDPVLDSVLSLSTSLINLNLQAGVNNSLDAKLNAVWKTLEDLNAKNDQAAINSLYVFISAVEAQRGSALTDAEADSLIADALAIIEAIEA